MIKKFDDFMLENNSNGDGLKKYVSQVHGAITVMLMLMEEGYLNEKGDPNTSSDDNDFYKAANDFIRKEIGGIDFFNDMNEMRSLKKLVKERMQKLSSEI